MARTLSSSRVSAGSSDFWRLKGMYHNRHITAHSTYHVINTLLTSTFHIEYITYNIIYIYILTVYIYHTIYIYNYIMCIYVIYGIVICTLSYVYNYIYIHAMCRHCVSTHIARAYYRYTLLLHCKLHVTYYIFHIPYYILHITYYILYIQRYLHIQKHPARLEIERVK